MKITDEIKATLEAVRLKHPQGLLHEEDILREAQKASSPLHKQFTWEDTDAARKWRLQEARELIMRVTYLVPTNQEEPTTLRYYASLASDRIAGGGYRAITDVLSQAEWRDELLRTALAELQNLQKRYKDLVELVPVFAALDKVTPKQSRRVISNKPIRPRSRHAATAR